MDLARIARHLAKLAGARRDMELVPLSESDVSVVVVLCGCPRACGDKAEVKTRADRCLVVAGESLNGKAVPEAYLPSCIERELVSILEAGLRS